MLRDIIRRPEAGTLEEALFEEGYSRNVFGVAKWASAGGLDYFEYVDRAEVFGKILARHNTFVALSAFRVFARRLYFGRPEASTYDKQIVLDALYTHLEQRNQQLFQKLKRPMRRIILFNEAFYG